MKAVHSAVWDEVDKLGAHMDTLEEGSASDMRYKIGNLYGKKVLLGSTGVGIKRARTWASFVIRKFKPGLIISAGLGVGLSHDLKGGVAEAAIQSKTPVMSIRSISDESRERLPDLGTIYDTSGKLALGKAVLYFLSSLRSLHRI
ncbi:MAG: hypothetical protein ACHQ6U_03815 [Thermodesulfobacteriota bacterium]